MTTNDELQTIHFPTGLVAAAASRPTCAPIAWLWRYLPAEALSLSATLLATWVVLTLTDNVLIAAVAATWAECVVYYGIFVIRKLSWRGLRFAPVLRVLRDLAPEFGPAELLDSFLIRPAALAAGMALAPLPVVGAIVGKLVADLCFYLLTIISYELLQRHRSRGKKEAL